MSNHYFLLHSKTTIMLPIVQIWVFFHSVDNHVSFVPSCHHAPYLCILKLLIGRAYRSTYYFFLISFAPYFVLTVDFSVDLVATFAGTSYISWQNVSSCCCCNLVSDVCSCLRRGIHLISKTYYFLSVIWLIVYVFWHQVIPQAICTRYGLAVGANFVWLVRILMVICYPISYPIGKVNLQNRMIHL